MLRRSLFSKLLAATLLITALLVASAIGLLVFFSKNKTDALSATDFQAGRIISDDVFYNKDAMSANDIQNFLNGLIPNCDVQGTQPSGVGNLTNAQYAASIGWPAPPYVCLNKYYENPQTHETSYERGGGAFAGGLSAAQIIYNAAQQYGINPQVLLVMLKKESLGPLTTDTWPLKSQYKYAMGYACPDSGPNNSANCDASQAGFYNQMMKAAWQLKYYKDHPNDYRYKIGWNDIQYSPDTSCGTKRVYVENIATLSLYIYTPYTPNDASLKNYPGEATCGSYGNRNFFMFFSQWFGSPSTPPATKCDSKVSGVNCVWSVIKGDGSQFLTTSESELSNAVYQYGWVNEGIIFYASATQQPGTVPVHRLRKDATHYYTADPSEYTTLKNTTGWTDEGVRFYEFPSTTSSNVSHKIYKLYNATNGKTFWLEDGQQKDYLLTAGYTVQSTAFNAFSGLISPPSVAPGRDNIYELKQGAAYFYSTSLTEVESAINNIGFQYQGVLTTANAANTGTPVYRLFGNGEHFYTTDTTERDNAISKYGYKDEGVRFYIDTTSGPIYRFIGSEVQTHRYVSDTKTAMTLANRHWKYEKMLSLPTDPTPTYRFTSLSNGEHFYTIDVNEAMNISNRGWQYEKIAFSASATTGAPVYRLFGNGEHFYTTDTTERDNAISKYGYKDEGVRFYVNASSTGIPVYRLLRNNDHFYTTDTTERDNAISKYGYKDEGVRFYLPSN